MSERVVSVMTNETVGLFWECQCWDDRLNREAIRKVLHEEVTYGHEYVKGDTHFYCYHAEFACFLLIAKSIVINFWETSRVVSRSLIDVRLVQGCIHKDEEERGGDEERHRNSRWNTCPCGYTC